MTYLIEVTPDPGEESYGFTLTCNGVTVHTENLVEAQKVFGDIVTGNVEGVG